ncbi:hypothetical protein ACIRPQ_29340 [Streptomyces sp. NPDC101213]|uniref:hypothetical protein n=1 Tax=Streptomyces sp. NPDC101213 TaxID=3366130 RepID=UPI003818068A
MDRVTTLVELLGEEETVRAALARLERRPLADLRNVVHAASEKVQLGYLARWALERQPSVRAVRVRAQDYGRLTWSESGIQLLDARYQVIGEADGGGDRALLDVLDAMADVWPPAGEDEWAMFLLPEEDSLSS